MGYLQVSATFNLKRDEPFGLGVPGIGIDEDGHDVSVDDVDECVAVGDDLILVPLAGLDEGLEVVGASQRRQEAMRLPCFGFYHLAAPCADSARCFLLIELAGVGVVVVEVGLIALDVPLGVLLRERFSLLYSLLLLVGHLGEALGRDDARPGRNIEAAILDAAVGSGALQLHLDLELEVGRLTAAPDDVSRSGRMLRRGDADDAAIFNVPYVRRSIPSVEGLAIEDLRPAIVIVEVDGIRVREGACGAPSARLLGRYVGARGSEGE